jgi:hypothetical protein
MVMENIKVYLIENDHRLQKYCEEKGYLPNTIPTDKFVDVAKDIGWVMSIDEYEMHHNTRTLPTYYYLRMKGE